MRRRCQTPADEPSVGTGAPRSELEELQVELNTTDLSLIVRDDRDPARPDGDVVYAITVRNLGPNPASSTVLVVEGLPGSELRSVDGRCRHEEEVLVCELGEVPTGQAQTLTVARRVECCADSLRLTARVSNRFGPDVTPTDHVWEEVTRVSGR